LHRERINGYWIGTHADISSLDLPSSSVTTSDKPAVRGCINALCEWHRRVVDEETCCRTVSARNSHAVRQSDGDRCLSQRSINKAGYVQKEIKFALDVADEQPEDTIFLIPLKLEECDVPERLSRWQWVNLFSANGYERLLKALRSRAGGLGLSQTPTGETPRLHEEPLLPGVNWLSDQITARHWRNGICACASGQVPNGQQR
jgi:hypothetical protein